VIVPEKNILYYSSGSNHLKARVVGGIADEGPMAGYSDCPRNKNYYYSSGINHLLARAVGGKADEGPMAGYSDCPQKKIIIIRQGAFTC